MVEASVLRQVDRLRPVVRSVSSVAFAIGGNDAFDRAVEAAVNWMRSLNPAIPADAATGRPIDVGGGGDHPARAVALEHPGGRIWSATIDNPDSNVLGRTWVTEITIAESVGEIHFGTRLLNVTRHTDEPFVPSVPGVVRDVISLLPCAADGVSLSERPTYIDSEEEFDQFVELLENPIRRLPVIAMAESVTRIPLTNIQALARRLAGAAHVVGIAREQAWQLTRRAGRELSVFDGAVRLYRPGLRLDDADPYDHPLWLPLAGRAAPSSGSPIIARVLSLGIAKGTTDYPRFEAVRQASAQRDIDSRLGDTSDAELIQLIKDENQLLQQQLEQLRSEHNQWLLDADLVRSGAEREISELKAEAHRNRTQNDLLRHLLRDTGSTRQREPLTDFGSFAEWAERNISPNIWFAPKAIKSIEGNDQFRSPEEIGEAIYLLDEVYAEIRRSNDNSLQSMWQDGLARIGLVLSPCFSRPNDIRRFPEYSVSYRQERFWCDLHLKYGGGTDPRSMFRIYFHWHESDRVLLIGHLPTHLDNNMTN